MTRQSRQRTGNGGMAFIILISAAIIFTLTFASVHAERNSQITIPVVRWLGLNDFYFVPVQFTLERVSTLTIFCIKFLAMQISHPEWALAIKARLYRVPIDIPRVEVANIIPVRLDNAPVVRNNGEQLPHAPVAAVENNPFLERLRSSHVMTRIDENAVLAGWLFGEPVALWLNRMRSIKIVSVPMYLMNVIMVLIGLVIFILFCFDIRLAALVYLRTVFWVIYPFAVLQNLQSSLRLITVVVQIYLRNWDFIYLMTQIWGGFACWCLGCTCFF